MSFALHARRPPKGAATTLDKVAQSENHDTAIWVMELRRRHDMTQEDLAARVGAASTTVVQWETGRCRPSRAKVRRGLARLGREAGMEHPLPAGSTRSGFALGRRNSHLDDGIIDLYAEIFGGKGSVSA